MIRVIFLHGLNTFGDDDLHIGPLRFGFMHRPWAKALEQRGCEVLPLTGLGFGSVSELASRAKKRLCLSNWFSSEVGQFHIIGHSIGGLVARKLATDPDIQKTIKGVLTVGSPHHGARAAEFGIRFRNEFPRLGRLLARIGYDTSTKGRVFSHFTASEMKVFNSTCVLPDGIDAAHALCKIDRQGLSLPLMPLYRHLHPDESRSDGFIQCESQAWGREIGSFSLDHFASQGFFFHFRRQQRKANELEFERLVDAAVRWMSDCAVSK